MNIQKFTFNNFQENTYVLYDQSKKCIIIDPGCQTKSEENTLFSYIQNLELQPVGIYNTHNHIDHVFGITAVREQYSIPFYCHEGEIEGLRQVPLYAPVYGLTMSPINDPDGTLKEGENIQFGNTSLEVLFTPGHSPASVCFLHREEKVLIAGDVLFQNSIGRTDLPGGNYETLMTSIEEKLMPLNDEVIVYPGHGENTTIGTERSENPFIQEWERAGR